MWYPLLRFNVRDHDRRLDMCGCHSWGHMPEMVFVFGVILLLFGGLDNGQQDEDEDEEEELRLKAHFATGRQQVACSCQLLLPVTPNITVTRGSCSGREVHKHQFRGFEKIVHRPKNS